MPGKSSTVLKLGLLAALAGGVYFAIQYVKNQFSFKVKSFGTPSGWPALKLPILMQFNNPLPIAISVDNVLVNAYMQNGSSFVHVGQVNQPNVSITSGGSETWISPILDLTKVAGGILSQFDVLWKTKKINIRVDVTVTYKGITLPTQSFTETVGA